MSRRTPSQGPDLASSGRRVQPAYTGFTNAAKLIQHERSVKPSNSRSSAQPESTTRPVEG